VKDTFKAGQLVQLVGWLDQGVGLLNMPGHAIHGFGDARLIGHLMPWHVSLVVYVDHVERTDGSNVYVIGPHGGGWTFGTWLVVVGETPQ
jgi:hypothetical protein